MESPMRARVHPSGGRSSRARRAIEWRDARSRDPRACGPNPRLEGPRPRALRVRIHSGMKALCMVYDVCMVYGVWCMVYVWYEYTRGL